MDTLFTDLADLPRSLASNFALRLCFWLAVGGVLWATLAAARTHARSVLDRLSRVKVREHGRVPSSRTRSKTYSRDDAAAGGFCDSRLPAAFFTLDVCHEPTAATLATEAAEDKDRADIELCEVWLRQRIASDFVPAAAFFARRKTATQESLALEYRERMQREDIDLCYDFLFEKLVSHVFFRDTGGERSLASLLVTKLKLPCCESLAVEELEEEQRGDLACEEEHAVGRLRVHALLAESAVRVRGLQ